MEKKNVVIVGGGNGGSISIRAMKQFPDHYNISAVIGMSDSGGSSGRLREEFDVLPPGDILRGVIAMSRYDYDTMRHIFYETRFSEYGKLQGFGLGHLFIALAEKYNGGIVDAIRALAQALDVVGPVFPVTTESSDLCAELVNGDIIIGEHNIDRPSKEHQEDIHRVWLQPTPIMYERTKQELRDADYIIIGPGSFYTSIIATLLPEGVKDILRESKAKLIFVSGNGIELEGEKGPRSLYKSVQALNDYLPRPVDAIISNSHELNEEQKSHTKKKVGASCY